MKLDYKYLFFIEFLKDFDIRIKKTNLNQVKDKGISYDFMLIFYASNNPFFVGDKVRNFFDGLWCYYIVYKLEGDCDNLFLKLAKDEILRSNKGIFEHCKSVYNNLLINTFRIKNKEIVELVSKPYTFKDFKKSHQYIF